MKNQRVSIEPSARRLVSSLRDIGYSFPTAAADLVDNSVSAGASNVDISIRFAGRLSQVIVSDDGAGMAERELFEALRFGTRREYSPDDLGRFGLGLKTASISLGRRLTVVTRRARQYRRLYSRVLDLDHIDRRDRWEILDGKGTQAFDTAARLLSDRPGTVLVIEELDRMLPERHPDSGWARRRFATFERHVQSYLGMVFHRLLERNSGTGIRISVNGSPVRPWNPFAPGEEKLELPRRRLEIEAGGSTAHVGFQGYVLPPRERFSSQEAFEQLAGPRRWNRQQGLYVYRGDRMIQSGGWNGLRAADEHTKLARAAIDFGTELDEFFRIDVAKMRIALPAQIKTPLERPVRELCHRAQVEYRSGRNRGGTATQTPGARRQNGKAGSLRDVALALNLAAIEAQETDALERIMVRLRQSDPTVAAQLGW